MIVFKFGGASVKDGPSVQNVANIIKQSPATRLVIVLSAMDKMTNAFEALAMHHFKGNVEKSRRQFELIRNFHLDLMHPLFPNPSHEAYAAVDRLLNEVTTILAKPALSDFDQFYDQLIPYGELLSTQIVSQYLYKENINHRLIDARTIVATDDKWREARVDWDATQKNTNHHILPALTSGQRPIVLTQGFIGADAHGNSTTLGREGSDYTAAVLAYCLNAEKVVIWKDVPGLLNADPKMMANTVKINEISYGEAMELAYYGATIIHPKTIKPLENKKIPLLIKPFSDPAEAGSVISSNETKAQAVACYIYKFDQTLLSITPRDFSFINTENLSDIFLIFKKHNIKINMMQNSAISFSVCFDGNQDEFSGLLNSLQNNFRVLYNHHLQLITIRNHQQSDIEKVLGGRKILLEQRSRSTLQMLVSGQE